MRSLKCSWTAHVFIFSLIIAQSSGWTDITLNEDTEQFETSYLDFTPDQRIEFRLIQYLEAIDMDFDLVFKFFESDSRSTYLGELMFNWNTKAERQSIISLYESTGLSFCYASDTALLDIPQSGLIELGTNHLYTMNQQSQGDYKDGCDETTGWGNWRSLEARVQKVVVKLEDLRNSDSGYELSEHFTIEYRLVHPCKGGHYYSDSGCSPCSAGFFSAGGFTETCTLCPDGKSVPEGEGSSAADCYLESCEAGQVRDSSLGCVDCVGGTYSAGGAQVTCMSCAGGTFSAGKSAECTACAPGTFSPANSAQCTECAAGSYSAGAAAECDLCAKQHFSAAGAEECCHCPEGQTSTEGSATCVQCSSDKILADGSCSGVLQIVGNIHLLIVALVLLFSIP